MDQAPRIIEGRFTKADAYWKAAVKTPRTD